jgi:hypothetical protein
LNRDGGSQFVLHLNEDAAEVEDDGNLRAGIEIAGALR